MSSPDLNPYEPVSHDGGITLRFSRWLRTLAILNVILVAIPASAITFAYISMQLELRRQEDVYADGPTVIFYETDFVGVSGPAWPMLAYFVVPNVLMLAYVAIQARSQRMS